MTAENKLNPRMVTLARESRGLTQKELADKLGITQSNISMVEQGITPANDTVFNKLQKLLQYPGSFFFRQGEVLPPALSYRKREHVAAKLMIPLEARINLYRLNIEALAQKVSFPAPNVPVLDLMKYNRNIEQVAKQLRKHWKMPKGTINNLTDLLEANGIIVITFDFGTERVDSRTFITADKTPVILINKLHHADRQRFSLAYELGHLVMHTHTLSSFDREIGHEANLFAAGFLMPEKEIKSDFGDNITILKLAGLKRKWKVSMQALAYRAADTGLLTDNQKRYLLQQFNDLKIRRREPPELDILKEHPKLLRNLITKYKTKAGLSVKEISAFFHLEPDEFTAKYNS